MTATVYDVLSDLRVRYSDNRTRGDAFERLMQQVLTTDPLYAGRFTNVWLWMEWPDRKGKVDTGVDLVAQDVDGGYIAIQCKFYDEHHPVSKEDVNSFLATSGKAPFSERLVVSTTDKWSNHAEDALADQHIPVARIGMADLAESSIDWSAFKPDKPSAPLPLRKKKVLRKHQRAALEDVFAGFAEHDRGKLIMACGTGKTFTSLKIAERTAAELGRPAHVLFLVPSISLLNQTLREWTAETELQMRSFAVCSDAKVGKASGGEDIRPHDLSIPATTDPEKLAHAVASGGDHVDMTVVFSTYHSIDAVADAQAAGVPEFDLIVCDEAHRTTGVTLADEDESAFVKVHDGDYLTGKRRLYMTATPRIFQDETKTKADEHDAVLVSMDDEHTYGPELHRLGFGKAVEQGLLTDYKVLVLQVDEGHVSRTFQHQLADENMELNLEDAARIVGCWNGLAKRGTTLAGEGFAADERPMRRAVAFSRTIKDSKAIVDKFGEVIHAYTDGNPEMLQCELQHVDGQDNALVRNERLAWLKDEPDEGTCRILSNAKCLSEGVDVPDLDAVLFLNPRNSVVDVVQSVGRVMRKAEGKRYGYIILPVAIPEGLDPSVALSDNKRYRVVWEVLQALRAHDDRFNALVNQLKLNKRDPKQIDLIGVGGDGDPDGDGDGDGKSTQGKLPLVFPVDEWRDAIFAKIVDKVGERRYWEQWADDIRLIAERHVIRIQTALADPAKRKAFDGFVSELRANLNPDISDDDAVDMLAQHIVTRPVFEALFKTYNFTESNPVSRSMAEMLERLEDETLENEAKTLDKFYEQVRVRAEGIDNPEGRQSVITELYEQFFRKALPKTADAMGIVYTPIQIVDFIIRAVNDALIEHFGTDLGAEGVQVLDPYTGTGTFIVRLLQSGLIPASALSRKYQSELHANEILLLAYYIAAINIEAAFDELDPGGYTPFDGVVLTDTFQLAEDPASMEAVLFPENNERVRRQQSQDIRVIIGNPPYSVGQSSANDDNANRSYPAVDSRIEQTYKAESSAHRKASLNDSYVRAFRWATDRIKDDGIVCFVSNGGWLDSSAGDGIRKSFAKEFDHIYVVNLRGNQRTAGELSKKEGGKVFGSGSRATIAITLLVRTGRRTGDSCDIRYLDIGDYLTREEKLDKLSKLDLPTASWVKIQPNEHGDWLTERDADFTKAIALGAPKRGGSDEPAIVREYTGGVKTNRSVWCWNFSHDEVARNMEATIEFFNSERVRYHEAVTRGEQPGEAKSFVSMDSTQISWDAKNWKDVERNTPRAFEADSIRQGVYRAFTRQWIYLNRDWNNSVYQIPSVFPAGTENFGIYIVGKSSKVPFSALMVDAVPDYDMTGAGSHGQFFPRYIYDLGDETDGSLFERTGPERQDNISDEALADFRKTYGESVTKDDIFYYVYGLLHAPDYRETFADDLVKSLPRIPKVADFGTFSDAGRKLSTLHLGYESTEPFALDDPSAVAGFTGSLRVSSPKYPKKRDDSGKSVDDRSRLILNSDITLTGIPAEVDRYRVGTKTPVDWLIDRYGVATDTDSQIVNDANDWCSVVNDPRYIVDLAKRLVTIAVESARIIDAMPPMELVQ